MEAKIVDPFDPSLNKQIPSRSRDLKFIYKRHEFSTIVDEECRITNIISIIDGKLIFKRKRYVKGRGSCYQSVSKRQERSKSANVEGAQVKQNYFIKSVKHGSNASLRRKKSEQGRRVNQIVRFDSKKEEMFRSVTNGKKKK